MHASGDTAAGVWLVERDGLLVGTVGGAGPVSPEGDQELGYGLVPDARGQGVATEAVGAVCAVLERRPGVRRLTAEVLPGNTASLRLLARLGFVEIGGGQPPQLRLGRAVPGAAPLRRTDRRPARLLSRCETAPGGGGRSRQGCAPRPVLPPREHGPGPAAVGG